MNAAVGLQTFLAALGIGGLMGFIGGGGGTVYVLFLTLTLQMPPGQAVATAVPLAAVTSLAALIVHWKAGRVHVRPALYMGVAGATAAVVGSVLLQHTPTGVLVALLATAMVGLSLASLLKQPHRWLAKLGAGRGTSSGLLLAAGLLFGFATGSLGLSSTAPVTTFLVTAGGLEPEVALGTAVLATVLVTGAATSTYLTLSAVNLVALPILIGGAVMGGLLGAALSGRVNRRALLVLFAVLTAITAVSLAFDAIRR